MLNMKFVKRHFFLAMLLLLLPWCCCCCFAACCCFLLGDTLILLAAALSANTMELSCGWMRWFVVAAAAVRVAVTVVATLCQCCCCCSLNYCHNNFWRIWFWDFLGFWIVLIFFLQHQNFYFNFKDKKKCFDKATLKKNFQEFHRTQKTTKTAAARK